MKMNHDNPDDGEDSLSLLPVYRFEWEGRARETSDPDFTTAPSVSPDAVENLAQLGREDPDCEVTLISMDN